MIVRAAIHATEELDSLRIAAAGVGTEVFCSEAARAVDRGVATLPGTVIWCARLRARGRPLDRLT